MPKSQIEIGHQCGFVTVINEAGYTKKSGKYWKCECICGNVVEVSGSNLNPKNKRSIKSCGCKRYENMKTGTKDVSGTYMCNLIANAKRRNKEFDLSIEYLQTLWEKQKGKCAISGLDINLVNKRNYQEQTASLDRIDSSKGYLEGNVQWVHKTINFMKTTMSDEEFIEMCHTISKHQTHTGFLEDR